MVINYRAQYWMYTIMIKSPYFFPLFLSPEPPKLPFCCALAFNSFSACSIQATGLSINKVIIRNDHQYVLSYNTISDLLLFLFLLNVSHVNLQNTDTNKLQGHNQIQKLCLCVKPTRINHMMIMVKTKISQQNEETNT